MRYPNRAFHDSTTRQQPPVIRQPGALDGADWNCSECGAPAKVRIPVPGHVTGKIEQKPRCAAHAIGLPR